MTGDITPLVAGAVEILILWLAICVHESAHGWMAERLGDPAARAAGRISLNPLRHFDPFGMVALPIVMAMVGGPVFGWGKPSPVLGREMSRPWDAVWVAAAGPLANLALCGAAILGLALVVLSGDAATQQSAADTLQWALMRGTGTPVTAPIDPGLYVLIQFGWIQGALAIFHLLPLPPLDGGEIAARFLPPDWAARFVRLRRYGIVVAMAFAMLTLRLLATPVLLAQWIATHLPA